MKPKYLPHPSHHRMGGIRCVICGKLDTNEIHSISNMTYAAEYTKSEIESFRRLYRKVKSKKGILT